MDPIRLTHTPSVIRANFIYSHSITAYVARSSHYNFNRTNKKKALQSTFSTKGGMEHAPSLSPLIWVPRT